MSHPEVQRHNSLKTPSTLTPCISRPIRAEVERDEGFGVEDKDSGFRYDATEVSHYRKHAQE
eukprot:745662-Hanusia_phi.AAC.1